MHTLLVLLAAVQLTSGSLAPVVGQAGGPPALTLVVPRYPLAARKARMTGFGVVEVVVAPDGSVTATSASGSNPLLARAAERSVALWVFSASEDTRCATVVIEFRLDTSAPDDTESPMPEVAFVSPHFLVVTAPTFPGQGLTIRDPLPEPCFVYSEGGETVVCEKALRYLPLQ